MKRNENLEQLIRYFSMAAVIVVIELVSFVILNNFLGVSYLIATPATVLVSIILNWYFSRIFVFKKSRYNPRKEFVLVFAASVVGILLQTSTAFLGVETLKLTPILAKILAIGVTSIWNYFIRKKFIFNVVEKL